MCLFGAICWRYKDKLDNNFDFREMMIYRRSQECQQICLTKGLRAKVENVCVCNAPWKTERAINRPHRGDVMR